MRKEIIIAGSGGQGVLLAGQILAHAAMLAGKKVTWTPEYGPATRGGTANCSIVVSDEDIGSPLVEEPTCIIVMNHPSFEKFLPVVRAGCLMTVNTSLVPKELLSEKNRGVSFVGVDANALAEKAGNPRAANLVMLGACISLTNIVPPEKAVEAIREWSKKNKKSALLEENEEALKAGFDIVS